MTGDWPSSSTAYIGIEYILDFDNIIESQPVKKSHETLQVCSWVQNEHWLVVVMGQNGALLMGVAAGKQDRLYSIKCFVHWVVWYHNAIYNNLIVLVVSFPHFVIACSSSVGCVGPGVYLCFFFNPAAEMDLHEHCLGPRKNWLTFFHTGLTSYKLLLHAFM